MGKTVRVSTTEMWCVKERQWCRLRQSGGGVQKRGLPHTFGALPLPCGIYYGSLRSSSPLSSLELEVGESASSGPSFPFAN